MRTFSNYYFGMKFLRSETIVKLDNLDVRPLYLEKRSAFEMLFHLKVVSAFLNTCVRDQGDSFSRLPKKTVLIGQFLI